MKTVNLQVRINEDLKQEVSSILKAQGLSYTSMLDALFRQIIKNAVSHLPLLYQQQLQMIRKHQAHSIKMAHMNNQKLH